MGLKLYNTLPTFLETESHSFVSFRLSLKKFLLVFSICSIDEFYNTCKLEKHKLQEYAFLANPYITIHLFIAAECH